MSVLIEGMEMPTSCTGCKFWSITSCIASYQGEKSCPLIEVPEPHGDLIDRKALMEGEGRYFISICKEGIDVEEILRAKAIIPASEDG